MCVIADDAAFRRAAAATGRDRIQEPRAVAAMRIKVQSLKCRVNRKPLLHVGRSDWFDDIVREYENAPEGTA